MFSHTKKVGSSGRFGARAGKKVRDEVRKVEEASKKDRKCPSCGKSRVKRLQPGVWACGQCKNVFSGGSYSVKAKKPEYNPEEGAE